MKGVIYSYKTPSGKMYIGQTLYLQRKRLDKHKYEALTKKADTPFAHAIRKYGWEIIRNTYTVIEEVFADTKQELKNKLTERENYYIEYLDTFVPKGYNVKFTNQRKLGEYRNKKLMYQKISNSLKGKYLNEENSRSKKIINYSTKEMYPSVSEAARVTGITAQSICGVLKGKRIHSGGYKWCYINEDGTIDTSNIRGKKRKELPVYCVELDKIFISAYEAAKYIGKPAGKGNIRLACMNNVKRYGYTWEYINKHDNTVPSQ